MRPHVVSGSDAIAVLSILAKFNDTCSPKRILESIAVQVFQFFVEKHAESLLLTRVTESSMVEHSKRCEMLRTYRDVVKFLLRTYETDGVVAKAYNDVVNFCQSSAMTEENFYRMNWDKALRCEIVLSNRRLRSLCIDGLLSGTRTQTRQFLVLNPRSDHRTVA